eukprot:6192700-Pleurochrysis_carterae.AAC.2
MPLLTKVPFSSTHALVSSARSRAATTRTLFPSTSAPAPHAPFSSARTPRPGDCARERRVGQAGRWVALLCLRRHRRPQHARSDAPHA